MKLTLYQLEILNAIAVYGSATKAAKKLRISQPTITRQLGSLEDELNTQLFLRNKKGMATLTYAGEFWLKKAVEILAIKDQAEKEHQRTYNYSKIIRFGIVPNFRGSFISNIALIMQRNSNNSKFELVYDASSKRLVDKLKTHQLDFAIIDNSAIENDKEFFEISHLFEDKFVWAVPSSISENEMSALFQLSKCPPNISSTLMKHVEVQLPSIVKTKCENWYKKYLPSSNPVFSAPTWTAAIELVADGLATSHIALSLIPYQRRKVIDSITLYDLKGIKTTMVLATKKHLMTQSSYKLRRDELVNFCRTSHANAISKIKIKQFKFDQ